MPGLSTRRTFTSANLGGQQPTATRLRHYWDVLDRSLSGTDRMPIRREYTRGDPY